MSEFAPVDYAMIGFILGMLFGFFGVLLWVSKGSRAKLRRKRSPKAVSCLLCGRPNPVGVEEQEVGRLVCRCGQPLYLTGLVSQPHPRPR